MGLDFKYLQLLETKKIRPNFWCSQEYFEKAKFKETVIDSSVCIENEDGQGVFPPISLEPGVGCLLTSNFWSDFSDNKPFRSPEVTDFLDYEYIYDPKSFLNMAGKKWQTFRKNCRKYPKRHEGVLHYIIDDIDGISAKIEVFFEKWLEANDWIEYHDGEVMVEYILNGANREVLVTADEVCGMNIWDENYRFINYRFCVCLDQPFLSEYMRFLFYTQKAKQDKLVNDGGVLDRPELKRFKDKLNPLEVNEIHSWNHTADDQTDNKNLC